MKPPPTMTPRNAWLPLPALAVLSACALQPPPRSADVQQQSLPGVIVPGQWTGPGAAAEPVAAVWLAVFKDPKLDALVAEAMQHNPDLLVAAARVEVASEYANLADSTLYPQVNLLARGGGQMGGDSSGLQGVGVFADWELDLWGRVRSARAAQKATYESTRADAEFARQSIAALVAKSYFLAVEAGLQQQLAEEMVGSADKLVSLTEQRLRIGRGDGYDAALSRANAATFRDSVERFKLARTQALRALEALLGRYPSATVDVAAELATPPPPVPAGLPSELLERRPDVVAANRRVAAAFYGVEEAKAARLPTISLTGSVNDISSELFVLQDRDNPVWSAGASLLLPLFTGGGMVTQVRIRTAQQRQAIADYGRIGARAFGEVEDALAAEFAASRRQELLRVAASENQRALELAEVRYDIGSGNLIGVQQQQLAVHGSRSALVRMATERLVQRVNLYLALGGGFDAAPAVASVHGATR
jgi:NodT family efflux transporter outer membrane factor (OMF) lipoprotein